MNRNITYLSLGSNLGDKYQILQESIDIISSRIGQVKKIASIYQTPAWGFDGNDFLNTCIKVETPLNSQELIHKLLSIEKKLGRQRNNSTEYSNRVIDIDILFFNQETIISKDVIVPHPRMLDRKFVLAPLADIAENYIYPNTAKNITNLLTDCSDKSEIFKTELSLKKPVYLTDKNNYIVIEGNIGSGKTSLSTLISNQFSTKLILERFSDNPFLPKFYKNKERYAFPLEMSFLADRYHQLSENLAQYDLFKNATISDYYIFKSLIFAQITLQEDEFLLYRKMFDIMYKEIRKPDLYIYLYQKTDRLIENIKKRGRNYEQSISADYLEKVNKGYMNFIKTHNDFKTVIIDASELDFVNSEEDYYTILEKITNS